MLKTFSLVLAFVLVASCSSNTPKETDGEEQSKVERKPAKLEKFEATVKAKRLWSTKTGKGKGREYLRLVPTIFGSKIYAADASGNVYAFDLETGKRLWKTDTDIRISGAAGSYYGTVAVAGLNGETVALDAETGEIRWQSTASSEVLSAPAVARTHVIVQTIDARVFAFDIHTGELAWSYDHLAPVLSLRGTSSPVVEGGQVFVAFDNGQIETFSISDGSRQWEARVGQPKGKTDLERIVDIDGTPVVEKGLLLSGSVQGNLMALVIAKGQPIWKQPVSTFHRVSVGQKKVFTVTDDSTVKAFDMSNGKELWQSEALIHRGLGAPTTVGRYVAAVDDDGILHVLSQEDGTFQARFKPPGGDFGAPLIEHLGKLYILSDDGKLSAYALSSR